MTIQQLIAKRLRLFSRRKVLNMLDGNYDSVFKGKGVELESLRPYVPGDNVKDIDWRATARTDEVHTRLYAPLRDQRIVVIADTSPSMLLPSQSGTQKVESLYGLIVTLGMFVRKNRDQLALCSTKPTGKIALTRFSNTNNHIEGLLRSLDESVHRTAPKNAKSLPELLQHTLHYLKHRSAIFIVTDGVAVETNIKPLLTKLSARHQIFFLQIQPSTPLTGQLEEATEYFDIESLTPFIGQLTLDKKLAGEWTTMIAAWQISFKQMCRSTGTAYGWVEDPTSTPRVLQGMFNEAKRYAKRH
mgnify:CR=1 FL=1